MIQPTETDSEVQVQNKKKPHRVINTRCGKLYQNGEIMTEKCACKNNLCVPINSETPISNFELHKTYKNVTIDILKCPVCGKTAIVWYWQDDTEEITKEYDDKGE